MKPLEHIKVIDFSQFLAGPVCSLRLADLGAEVIKIERPGIGDICRQRYVSKIKLAGESTIFHAINRNKKSVSLDLKDTNDRPFLEYLVKRADVMIQNFRPGVAKKLSIDYETIKELNPKIVYGSISGYGGDNQEWYTRPGQDLLAQSIAGVMWLNNDRYPIPVGLPMADFSAGHDLVQGILALLVRRGITNKGGFVETSLLESLISAFHNELMTQSNDVLHEEEKKFPHVYKTKDNKFITIDKINTDIIQAVLHMENPTILTVQNEFLQHEFKYWASIFKRVRIATEQVLTWHQLRASDYYKDLQFEQVVTLQTNQSLRTTRCPLKIDGNYFYSNIPAPGIGEHNKEFKL